MPEDCEVAGLLAMMLMHDALHGARLDELGDLVTLADQDRTRWDVDQIAEAVVILRTTMEQERPGPDQIQAAIVACHATAREAAGLAIVESLAAVNALPGYHLLPAVHAHLLRRLRRLDEAADYYREALSLVTSDGERRFLERRRVRQQVARRSL